MTWRSRIQLYWVNGCLSYLLRMGLGKLFFGESISVRRHYPKWFGNLGILTSGLVLWRQKMYSFAMVLSQSGMEHKYGSGKMLG
jgi:hypothetical protein